MKRFPAQKLATAVNAVPSTTLNDEKTPPEWGQMHHDNRLDEDEAQTIITQSGNLTHLGEGTEDSQLLLQHQPQSYVRHPGTGPHLKFKKQEENNQRGSENESVGGHTYRSPPGEMVVDNTLQHSNVQDLRGNFRNKHMDSRQRFNQSNLKNPGSHLSSERHPKQPRNTSRVRFSLDLETAEQLMGLKGANRGLDVNENESAWQNGNLGAIDKSGEKGSPLRPTAIGVQRKREVLTRDAQKDASFDLEKAIEMREDKKVIRLSKDRIERLEKALLRQREVAANMRVALAKDGSKDNGKLRQLVDVLEKNIQKLSISKSQHFSESHQLRHRADQIERLKAHQNMLETERERLKEKLEQVLNSTKEKEKQLVDLMAERDELLEHKAKGSDKFVNEWESKINKVEASFREEKVIWEEELNACQVDWKNKMEDWSTKLKEKDRDICNLKASEETIIEKLRLCRQGIDEMQDAIQLSRGDTEMQKLSRITDDIGALELANSIHHDTESLKALLQESHFLQHNIHPDEHATSVALLDVKSQALDDKISKTLQLTDRLKEDMERKEEVIRQENANYDHMLAEKLKQMDCLEKQLAEKEDGMNAIVMELKAEVSILIERLHRERKERVQLTDLQNDSQQQLLQGLEKRESEWKEEMELLKGRFDEMNAVVALKDERIVCLEEEVKSTEDQLENEKQKCDSAIKEVKQRAADTLRCFVNGKENRLLEQLTEQRKAYKSNANNQTSFVYEADDESETASISNETSSLRDWIYSTGNQKQKRPSGIVSSRELCELSKHIEAEKSDEQPPSPNKTYKLSVRSGFMGEKLPRQLFECTGRNRALGRQDVLDILERQKAIGNTTFALLQSTVQVFE